MKKAFGLILLCLFLRLSLSAQESTLSKMAFLSGNWEMKTAKGKITEHWKKEKDQLNGRSYRHDLKGDSTLSESVLIKKIDGALYYCVTGFEKNNLGTTNFKLISTDHGTFIFENKNHDFPQRIVYQNKGKNNLLAWIEGQVNGRQIKSTFLYVRQR